MRELLLLSRNYISKDDFIKKIHLENYHLELGGNDDQLWILDDLTNDCIVIIDLLQLDSEGNCVFDEVDSEINKGIKTPYDGFLYSIQYESEIIAKKVLQQLDNTIEEGYYKIGSAKTFKRL